MLVDWWLPFSFSFRNGVHRCFDLHVDVKVGLYGWLFALYSTNISCVQSRADNDYIFLIVNFLKINN